MTVSDILLRVLVIGLMLFFAFVYYRASIDPEESLFTRVLYGILAKRYVRGPRLDPKLQARILSIVFICLALLASIAALSGV
jgi:hypothetical protein